MQRMDEFVGWATGAQLLTLYIIKTSLANIDNTTRNCQLIVHILQIMLSSDKPMDSIGQDYRNCS